MYSPVNFAQNHVCTNTMKTMSFFCLCPLVTVTTAVVLVELCVVVQVVSVCEGRSCNSCD